MKNKISNWTLEVKYRLTNESEQVIYIPEEEIISFANNPKKVIGDYVKIQLTFIPKLV